jgi:tripartite-type tricarboxylate transporter receptor subunit TctC
MPNRQAPAGRRAALLGALGLPVVARARPGRAAAWPSRPIRLVVPYAAGGTTDVLGRLVADWLGGRLGRPVVVENRGGAGATIGAAAVAQAAADGHTLLISNSGSHGISPHVYPNPGYDPLRDFAHVALVALTPHVVLVNPAHPAASLPRFVEASRRAGELRFAVSGIGASAHLLGVRLALAAGVRAEPVAYRGAGPAAADAIAGVVPALVDSVPSGAAHVRSGALRALATSGALRSRALPEVPTLREAGVEIVSSSWFGLSAPRGVPEPVLRRLSAEMAAMVADPTTGERLAALGSELPPGLGDYAGFVGAELEAWGSVVRLAGVRL